MRDDLNDGGGDAAEALWRRRFILLNLARIGATVVAMFGILIWQTDVARDGGFPALGIPLMLGGVVASFFAPKWLRDYWRTPPR